MDANLVLPNMVSEEKLPPRLMSCYPDVSEDPCYGMYGMYTHIGIPIWDSTIDDSGRYMNTVLSKKMPLCAKNEMNRTKGRDALIIGLTGKWLTHQG